MKKDLFTALSLAIGLLFFNNIASAQEVLNIKSPNAPATELSEGSITVSPKNLEIINPLALKHYTKDQILTMPFDKVKQINWLYVHSYKIIIKGEHPIDALEINNRDFSKRKIIDYYDSKLELMSTEEVQQNFKKITEEKQ